MIPIVGLVLGIVLGVWLQPDVPLWLEPYLPIAVIAALDAVFGGARAALEGIFSEKVFVVSFLSNVVVAAFIVWIGDQLGVHPESLRSWVRQAEVDDGTVPGVTSQEAAKVAELEKENRELRRANAILKSASAFFAAELDRPHR